MGRRSIVALAIWLVTAGCSGDPLGRPDEGDMWDQYVAAVASWHAASDEAAERYAVLRADLQAPCYPGRSAADPVCLADADAAARSDASIVLADMNAAVAKATMLDLYDRYSAGTAAPMPPLP